MSRSRRRSCCRETSCTRSYRERRDRCAPHTSRKPRPRRRHRSRRRYYPAALPYVVTVGAIDDGGEVAAFSTYGEHIDLVAPGTNVYSSFLDNSYAFSTGTSHATPFVTGGVALLKSLARRRGRELTDAQVKRILRRTADRLGTRLRD